MGGHDKSRALRFQQGEYNLRNREGKRVCVLGYAWGEKRSFARSERDGARRGRANFQQEIMCDSTMHLPARNSPIAHKEQSGECRGWTP